MRAGQLGIQRIRAATTNVYQVPLRALVRARHAAILRVSHHHHRRVLRRVLRRQGPHFATISGSVFPASAA